MNICNRVGPCPDVLKETHKIVSISNKKHILKFERKTLEN